ncbi:MarR family transcriptional regulator [Veillonella sp.]|uniref:MarR family winged helix-turn-helix transcriptional regulator n=1 Tax=Veillonella sp. TaxID=1926307 RepID=UPI0025FEBA44|nr:MarR family transcriptional regulator [Veillonella sp.]
MKPTINDQIAMYCNLLNEWYVAYAAYAKSIGLSNTALDILTTIYENPNCTQKDIAESCFLPKQTVNAVVTSFLKDGWVQLEELPSDRRNKTVNLTAEGLAKAREIMDKVHSCEITAMSQLTEDERGTLLKLTKTYIHKCSQAMAENIE